MEFGKLDMEDLLADESFINYCKKTSPADTARWETYIQEHPNSAPLIALARTRYIELFNAIAAADLEEQEVLLKNRLLLSEPAQVVHMQGRDGQTPKTGFFLFLKLAAAAVIVAALAVTTYYLATGNNTTKETKKIFVAAYGERKNLQLPDGSVAILNGGSKITVTDKYGASSRDIYLEGEAFFDVKHNPALPFIVHTSAMDVKALGTAFNVKAYPGEKLTEASLVRGLVEVTLKEEQNHKVLLHPNQKVQWLQLPEAKKPDDTEKLQADKRDAAVSANSLIQNLTRTDDAIKEIAWIDNKLVFTDETFADIALLLERWYGVKILFMDETIRRYHFTGIFEKEEITAVLSFLKESRSFDYELVPGDTNTIKLYK